MNAFQTLVCLVLGLTLGMVNSSRAQNFEIIALDDQAAPGGAGVFSFFSDIPMTTDDDGAEFFAQFSMTANGSQDHVVLYD